MIRKAPLATRGRGFYTYSLLSRDFLLLARSALGLGRSFLGLGILSLDFLSGFRLLGGLLRRSLPGGRLLDRSFLSLGFLGRGLGSLRLLGGLLRRGLLGSRLLGGGLLGRGTIEKEDPNNKELVEIIDNLTLESTLKVTGKVMENPKVKLNGMEFIPSSILVTSKSLAELPIDIKNKDNALRETRLDNRFLDLRREDNQLLFECQA